MNNPFFTINEAADIFSVSTATIRNWIKTGYLTLIERGKIDKQSVFTFKTQKLGKEKLVGRANKSQKDQHNHEVLTKDIYQALFGNNVENIGSQYEESLSDSYRNKEGIYYTPYAIVNNLLDVDDVENKTFFDPCCGSGNFIMRALELGFKPENIYGMDIDPVAVEITRNRIEKKTGFSSSNIVCADFLQEYKNGKLSSYDYIYTNPPWGKKIDKQEKIEYGRLLNVGTSNDTCSLFFFASLEILNPLGKLGLLLPEAFFNVATFEQARLKVLEHNIHTLKDYGKVFKGLQTGAVAFVLNKQAVELDQKIACYYKNQHYFRTAKSFLSNPKSIFNINCNEEEAEVIEYLFNLPHKTLENNAKWGLGIVTGNNAKYIKNKPENGFIPVYKGADITKEGLKPASNFIPDKFSMYQQVAPLELFNAKEKLIYKFISSNLCFHYDDKQSYVLNSANMVILDNNFPISMKKMTELLNSKLMNWLFNKLFNTHKVLRGDLEQLPIHQQFLDEEDFDEDKYLSLLNIERNTHGTFRIKN